MLSWLNLAQAGDLQPGDAAPAFVLLDQHGETHRLGDYSGRWLVLYFYPKDDTPGCTAEACGFRDDLFILGKMDVALLGVSLDEVESHQAFAEKYHLPFPLLSDNTGEVAEAYDALFSLGPIRFAKRHSFIVDPAGRLAGIYRSVTPKTHSEQIIVELRRLLSGSGTP